MNKDKLNLKLTVKITDQVASAGDFFTLRCGEKDPIRLPAKLPIYMCMDGKENGYLSGIKLFDLTPDRYFAKSNPPGTVIRLKERETIKVEVSINGL